MGWKLAELVVEITGNDRPLNATLDGVHRAIGRAGQLMTGLFAASATAAGAAVAAGIGMGIKEAVELQDILSRTKVIFGDAARLIIAEADRMAAEFGVVKSTFLDAAASFGAMFKGAGASARDAAILGNQLAKLGLDMRSFRGGATTTEEAMQALAAAMRGEFDPIERFNVFLTAADVSAQALAMGLTKSKDAVDNYAKKQATLALILKQTTDQQGDMARTIADAGPQMEMLWGNVTNLAETIGAALLPTINEWVTALNDRLGPAIEAAGFWARRFGDAFSIVQLVVGAAFENATRSVEAFLTNAGRVAGYLAGNWRSLITDAVMAVGTVFDNLATNFGDLAAAIWEFLQNPAGGFNFDWTPLMEGFEATADALPEMVRPGMVSVAGEIAQILAGGLYDETTRAIEKARAAAELAGAQVPQAQPKEGAAAGKRGIDRADEFWKTLLGGDKVAKEQLDVQKRQLEAQKELVTHLSKVKVMGAILAAAAP